MGRGESVGGGPVPSVVPTGVRSPPRGTASRVTFCRAVCSSDTTRPGRRFAQRRGGPRRFRRVRSPMHSSKSWFSFAVLTAAAALPAFAVSPQAPVQSAPVPVRVVSPLAIPRWAENSVVKLHLLIDAEGVPHNVVPAEWMPSELKYRVISAVEQWRFRPMQVEGRPTPTHVVLPLRLVRQHAGHPMNVAHTPPAEG